MRLNVLLKETSGAFDGVRPIGSGYISVCECNSYLLDRVCTCICLVHKIKLWLYI